MMNIHDYPVAIIGGGPVGMAAAAHLAERQIPFMLFEAGKSVGANLLDWGHVRVFSPWRYNIDKAAEKLLSEMNWSKPDEEGLPTGKEIVEQYLLPVSFHPLIEPSLHFSAKVISITKDGVSKVRTAGRENMPFLLSVSEGGIIKNYKASCVIDASGTWQNPNPIGTGGAWAAGEIEMSDNITYRIPDILGKDNNRYAGKSVVVVGAGHSAINSLLDLASLRKMYPDTKLHWVLHTEDLSKIYGGGEADALEARGALGTGIENLVRSRALTIHSPFHIHKLSKNKDKLTIGGYLKGNIYEIEEVDEIIANTGARPDVTIFREVRVQVDSALECVPQLTELIDPNVHSCGTVRPHGELELRQPEPNFYVVGVKSYGRAPTFLMATGYEQVRSIVAYLDGDLEAARRVELDLPETGVCSTGGNAGAACCSPAPQIGENKNPGLYEQSNNKAMTETKDAVVNNNTNSGCCGGAPSTNEDACCKLDEDKKAEGLSGCGCGTASKTPEPAATTKSCC